MPEYTAASGRHHHATFREQADAPVRCTGLGANLYMPRSDEAWAGYHLLLYAKIVFRSQPTVYPFGVAIRTYLSSSRFNARIGRSVVTI
jgi:hypothetical protein